MLVECEAGDDDPPRRWLALGPNQAGLVLELIVLLFDDGAEMVTHAMPVRSKYEELLPGGDDECRQRGRRSGRRT